MTRPSILSHVRPLTKAEVKRYRALATKKGREQTGLLLVEGWKSVEELLASHWSVQSLIVDLQRLTSAGETMLRACHNRSIEVRSGSAADVRSMSDVREDQGIVAVAKRPIVSLSDLPSEGDLLILDGVSDPGNVGTLIRTADWFGLAALVIGPDCATIENPKVIRSTMGSVFHLPVIEVDNLPETCRQLSQRGITLVTAEVKGGTWPRWVPPGRMALILGSESHGVSSAVRMAASLRVSIPSRGRAESLNVAAAGAILLSSLSEQRHG